MYSLILCGGSGTRLWPLSRKSFPKQFLKLYSDKSLLQETFLRMREIMPSENVFFITNQANFFNVFNQIKEVEKSFDKEQILVEPDSRNTMPAITYAFKHLIEKVKIKPDDPVVILPSDHYIGKNAAYLDLIRLAAGEVDSYVGTIGVTPTKPETGFGYIRKDSGEKIQNHYRVLEFVEKPDKITAEEYVKSGQYVWNSGMYIFSPRTFVHEMREHAPEFYSSMSHDLDSFIKQFQNLPEESIDVAISEKSNNVIVFEGDFGWNDIGSFDSLAEITSEKRVNQINIDSKNIFVHSTSGRLVTTLGVDDLNIIESSDSILVHRRGSGQDVKKIVNHLKENKCKELEDNIVSYRPWGSFEVLIDTPVYKVKKIVVYPGARLSLQSHLHRAEHWIIVRGLAKVVNGDKELFLRENESTFIPSLAKHRLENPGKFNVEMIEVQTGNYMEEDDIIRYDDEYNRIEK